MYPPQDPGTLCTCERVRMHLMQTLWVLLTPPTLGVDVVLVGSDDVTQWDVFWRATESLISKLQTLVLNLGQTFATMATITDQCLRIPHHRSSFIALNFYPSLCPQCSPRSNFQMYKAAVSPREKIANNLNISVKCQAPNGTQISNKLKSKSSQLKSKRSVSVFVEIKAKVPVDKEVF